MKYTINLSDEELSEIVAKLANELEDYQEEASKGLKKGFIKMFLLNEDLYQTTLVKKWAKILEP